MMISGLANVLYEYSLMEVDVIRASYLPSILVVSPVFRYRRSGGASPIVIPVPRSKG